jgi:homoserine dehydrogenase
MDRLNSAYYFRFSAIDKPGVLSKIAGILGDNRISISSVIQKERKIGGFVPIVMLTHEASESDVINALKLIDQLDVLTARTMMIRVEG